MEQNGNGARDFASKLQAVAAETAQKPPEPPKLEPARHGLQCALGLHAWSRWSVGRELDAIGGVRIVMVRQCTRCHWPQTREVD